MVCVRRAGGDRPRGVARVAPNARVGGLDLRRGAVIASDAEREVVRMLGEVLGEEGELDEVIAAWIEVVPRVLGAFALEVTVTGEMTHRRRHGRGEIDVVRTWRSAGFETTLGVSGLEPLEAGRALEMAGRWLVAAIGAVASRRRVEAARFDASRAARVHRATEALWLDLLATEPDAVFELGPDGVASARNAAARVGREDEGVMARVRASTPTRVGERALVRLLPRTPPALGERVATCVGKWRLTARQRDVLTRTLHGRSRREIAEELGCSEGAIDRHVAAIFRRAKVRDRMELALAVVSAP